MPDLTSGTYSETDDNNNAASPNGMPEGMSPAGVNNSWRAGMGAVQRSYDRDHGGTWVTVTGTANAIVLTYTVNPAAYVQGEKFVFKATASNTTATTVAIGSLAAVAVYKKGTSGPTAASGGEIWIGDIIELVYDGAHMLIVAPPVPAAATPTGVVSPFASTSGAPAGWLYCHGQAVSRSTYSALFGTISTAYGVGNGSTTFNVPDLRGRVIAGFDSGNATSRLTLAATGGVSANAPGNVGGQEAHSLTIAELASHTHTLTDPGHLHQSRMGSVASGGSLLYTASAAGSGEVDFPTTTVTTGITNANTGSGTAHNCVQPTLIMDYIIKY